MYILLMFINEYEQLGGYFLAAFNEKPSIEKLKTLLEEGGHGCFTIENLERIINNLGRSDRYEDTWYRLVEVEVGQLHTLEGM